MASPTLGNHSSGTAHASTTLAATVLNVPAGSLILAFIFTSTISSGTYSTVSSVADSVGGLTWRRRGGIKTTKFGNLEVWYAYAPSALTSDGVTATLSTATYDDAAIIVATFAGCNASAPFDGNASLPAFTTAASAAVPSTTVSTSSPDDLLIAAAFSNNSSAGISTPPSGFTLIGTVSNSVGTYYAVGGAADKSVSAVQSGITVAWGAALTTNGGDTYPMYVDALTADAAPASYARPRQMCIT